MRPGLPPALFPPSCLLPLAVPFAFALALALALATVLSVAVLLRGFTCMPEASCSCI